MSKDQYTSLYASLCKIEGYQEEAFQENEKQKACLAKLVNYLSTHKALFTTEQAMEAERLCAKVQACLLQQDADEKEEDAQSLDESMPEILSLLHKGYSETQNPLFLWEIYGICRARNQEIPPIVLAYFDECANNLHNAIHLHESKVYGTRLEDAIAKKKSNGREHAKEDVARAIGLHKKKQPNPFSSIKKYFAIQALIGDMEKVEQQNLAMGMSATRAHSDAVKGVKIAVDVLLGDGKVSKEFLDKHLRKHKKTRQL